MKLQILAPVAIAAIAAAGISLSTADSVIPFNEKTLTGGATNIGTLEPSSVPLSGPDASGPVKNGLDPARVITDYTIKLKNADAAGVSVDGGMATKEAPGLFKFNHAPGGGTGSTASDNIVYDDIAPDGSGEMIDVYVTPSFTTVVASQNREINSLPEYELTRLDDQRRRGIAYLHHDGVFAALTNDDSSQRINKIEGVVTFPGSVSANVTEVLLRDTGDNDISGAVMTITGNDFEITGFPAITTGNSVWVYVFLDSALESDGAMQLRLTGTFVP